MPRISQLIRVYKFKCEGYDHDEYGQPNHAKRVFYSREVFVSQIERRNEQHQRGRHDKVSKIRRYDPRYACYLISGIRCEFYGEGAWEYLCGAKHIRKLV